jgi:medium-chain acyl-[acyl-carrier-protein] hydrolase
MSMSDPRIFRPSPRPEAALRLFCFPYAGAGAPIFRLWPQYLPEAVDLIAFHPAGRGHRLREPPLDSIDAMVAATLDAFEPWMDRPFAFFGHSLGAIVASEAARVLQSQGRGPAHLFVSARPLERKREDEIHHLPDAEFVDAMNRRYQGIPAAIMEQPELLELLLPPLRADIRALEHFHPPADRPKIASPTTVFGGSRDRQVPVEALEAWHGETSEPCRIRIFDGDHFYIDPQRQALVGDIAGTLSAHLAAMQRAALAAQ